MLTPGLMGWLLALMAAAADVLHTIAYVPHTIAYVPHTIALPAAGRCLLADLSRCGSAACAQGPYCLCTRELLPPAAARKQPRLSLIPSAAAAAASCALTPELPASAAQTQPLHCNPRSRALPAVQLPPSLQYFTAL